MHCIAKLVVCSKQIYSLRRPVSAVPENFWHRCPAFAALYRRLPGSKGSMCLPRRTSVLLWQTVRAENSESLAEATILLILAALYDLHGSEAVLRQNLARPAQMTARMLREEKIGMIGFGQIARAMAVRLNGWDVQILACARRVHADAPGNVTWVGSMNSSGFLRRGLRLGQPERRRPRSLLNADRLRLLKEGAVLVNTARGAIIDEAALCEMARNGPICDSHWTHSQESHFRWIVRCMIFPMRF